MAEWLFVDGSSLIFRAFYGVPQTVQAKDGRMVNAVRGFMDTLMRVLSSRRPRLLAVASDVDWRPDWRVRLVPDYKAHRTAEPVPPLLEPQMPLIEEVLAAIGVDFIGAPDLEAEDVIASWVRQANASAEILSGDRDLFGIVRDDAVAVLYPEKGGLARIDEAEVQRRYGVPGARYWDFAVLRGDPSDGLPGVRGVGPKKAAELVHRYGGVEGVLEAGVLGSADSDYLRRAWQVIRTPEWANVPLPAGRRDSYPADPERLRELSEELSLGASAARLVDVLGSLPPLTVA